MKSYKSKINKFRRKIASFIVGEQVALFAPKSTCEIANSNRYLELDDASLGVFARHFLLLNAEIGKHISAERDCSVDTFSRMSAVTTLASLCSKRGQDMVITQDCYLGSQKIGNWQVSITKLPDDYEFGEDGVIMIKDENGVTTVTTSKALDDL